jgi:soluble lytic murein transglycosylase
MTKRISYLVAAFVALQTGAVVRGDSQQMNVSIDLASLQSEIPMHYRQQTLEILGKKSGDLSQDRGPVLAQFVKSKVRDLLPRPWRPKTSRIARALIETSNKFQMDPKFLMAVIQQESKWNPLAVGLHGEIGLMQIKPDTARWLLDASVDELSDENLKAYLRNPENNIALGAEFFARLRTQFNGRSEFYISAYNMGVGNLNRVLSEGNRPQAYLNKVVAHYVALNTSFVASDLSEQLTRVAQNALSGKGVASQTLVAR